MWQKSTNLSLLLGTILTWPSVGRAEANPCAVAYEQAQELRAEQRLREARHSLETCVAPSCSEFVRIECGRWLVEVESSLPSVVLAARKDGKEVEAVRVQCDGQPLVETLDGKAIPVDPGPHTLTFEADGIDPISMKLVFREGEKNRLVTAQLGEAPTPVAQPPHPRGDTSTPPIAEKSGSWLPYGLAGLGAVGISGFVALGMIGNSELKDRERTCAPTCSDSDVSSVKMKYYLADASLGVGVISLGLAGYLLFTSPRRPPQHAVVRRDSGFNVRLQKGGGYASVRLSF